jgi:ubiquitin carboxyl-terminal hydrolase 10
MSQDQQFTFFNFDNMSDSDRQIVETILFDRIVQSKAVDLPWKDEIYETVEDDTAIDYDMPQAIDDGHQIQYIHVPPVSHCIDMVSVCMTGAHFYTPPLYVLIDPSAPHASLHPSLIYQGMQTTSMVAPTVLTSAGYMAPLAHIMPQMQAQGMMLAPSMMQPPQSGSMVQPMMPPGLIQQPAAAPGMMLQGGMMAPPVNMLSPPRGSVLPPLGNSSMLPPDGAAQPVVVSVPAQVPGTDPLGGVLPPPTMFPLSVPMPVAVDQALSTQMSSTGFEMAVPLPSSVPHGSPHTMLSFMSDHDAVGCQSSVDVHSTAGTAGTSPRVGENAVHAAESLSDVDTECGQRLKDVKLDGNDYGFVFGDSSPLPFEESISSLATTVVSSLHEVSPPLSHGSPLTVNTDILPKADAKFPNGEVLSPASSLMSPPSGDDIKNDAVSPQVHSPSVHLKPLSQHPMAASGSDDSALLDVQHNSQWPAISLSCSTQSSSVPIVNNLSTKPKVSSWASLLKDTASATNAIVVNADYRQTSGLAQADGKMSQLKDGDSGEMASSTRKVSFDDLQKLQIGELLKSYKPNHRSVPLQPRGLTNRANWCYVNATLQALLACPPFYHLIKLLPPLHDKFPEDKSIAVMRSMVEFVNNFSYKQVKAFEKQTENAKGTVKLDIKCGQPFEPVQVYKMLQVIDYEAFKHGQQEDAEEFLSCILNRLHDEMVALMKLLDKDSKKPLAVNGSDTCMSTEVTGAIIGSSYEMDSGDTSVVDSRWEQVRSRNRTIFNNVADNESSPISAIFRGQICSILHQLGQKESATLQSFFTLQLDVQNENVKSVKDALEQLVSKESLQGYTCTKSKVEVDATQRMLLEELPPVLVLHLKWFYYDKNGGMQKCIKQVDFDIDLELGKELLSAHAKSKCPPSHRKYKLFAVVNHIGARAIGGHYTVDIFHPGYNCWIRCDDNNISSISASAVTKFAAPKVPYLIFYRRIEPS